MNSTHVLTRHPLIGALAGLLLVSACGSAAESTPTPNTPTIDTVIDRLPDTAQSEPAPTMSDAPLVSTPSTSPAPAPAATANPIATTPPASTTTPPESATPPPTSTTVPPVTVPPTTVPAPDPGPVDVVDVPGRTVFGVGVFETVDVDAVAGDVSARLGTPTTDSGWQPMAGQFNCAGSTDFRVLWWGDFRMTFERYEGDGIVRDELSAWTVGDPTVAGFAPIGDMPASSPSDIVTLEGIGLGSSVADVETAWANVNNAGDGRLVVVDQGGALTLGLDGGDQVVGFGGGPFDCPTDEMR